MRSLGIIFLGLIIGRVLWALCHVVSVTPIAPAPKSFDTFYVLTPDGIDQIIIESGNYLLIDSTKNDSLWKK